MRSLLMKKLIRPLVTLALVAATASLVVGCGPSTDLLRTRFSGSANELTDEFMLRAVLQRVHLKTNGSASVKLISVAAPEKYELHFSASEGEATEGITAEYVSDGTRIMLEFSNVSTPYDLWFEAID